MAKFRKEDQITVRLRQATRDRLDLAAAIASVRAEAMIGTGPWTVQAALPAAEALIAAATPAEVRAARALLREAQAA